jgi:outer membrane receptor protein involved in Fe transport
MLKNRIIILLAALSFSASGFAQMPSNAPAKALQGGKITGKIADKDQHVPMQYTNVVLYHLPDSVMVNGTITQKDGSFQFSRLKDGNYYLMVHFIGFQVKMMSGIKITPRHRFLKLPTIYLEPASATLGSVEVKAEHSRISYQVDKKVVNVTKDLMASAGSAIDVLENVPSVDVDLDGNVSLRGSSNFTVLIDGRPSVLEGNDALQQIPASAIQRIEIITNPSAKYDPEGVGGILNVILKKDKKLGLNGMINTSVSTGNKYRGNATLAYRTGKVNLFVSVDGSNRDMHMKMNSENETYIGDTTNYRNTDINGIRNRRGYGVKAGLDYYFSKKTSLSLSGRVGGYGFGMDNTSNRHVYSSVPQSLEEYAQSISHSNRWGGYYNGQLSFIHNFDDLGHKLEAMVYYSNRSSDDQEDQSDYITDMNWNVLAGEPSSLRTATKDSSSDLRIKLDYSKPIGEKGKLEAGLQSRFAHQNGDYTYSSFDTTLNDWVNNADYASIVDFKRNIHSAYVTFQNTFKAFGFQLGMRGEFTDRSVDNKNGTDPFVIHRFDYFPSAHFSYQLKNNLQVYTSYSKRIRRPRDWDLNPFPLIIDPYNVRIGNPELEPEYIDSYELGLQKILGRSFISFETYYRINKNKITRILQVGDDGIFYHTNINLNKDYSMGAELMTNLKLVKWLGINASMNIYNYRLTGNIEGADVASNSTNWSGRLTTSFNLKGNLRIQWMGIYRSKTVTLQGSRKGFFYTNLALRKDFLKRKLNVTVSARDLLGTAKYESIAQGAAFYSHMVRTREWPVVSLNVSYIINNYRQKRDKNQDNQEVPEDIGF